MDKAIYRLTLFSLRQSLPQGSQGLVEVVVGGGDGGQHEGLSIPTQRFLSRSGPKHEQTLPRRYGFRLGWHPSVARSATVLQQYPYLSE